MIELYTANWIFEVERTKEAPSSDYIVKDILTPKIDDFGAIMKFNDGYPYQCAIKNISKTTLNILTDSKVKGYKKVRNIIFIKKIGKTNR